MLLIKILASGLVMLMCDFTLVDAHQKKKIDLGSNFYKSSSRLITFFLQSRARFEQRHFENASDTGYRLRQLSTTLNLRF